MPSGRDDEVISYNFAPIKAELLSGLAAGMNIISFLSEHGVHSGHSFFTGLRGSEGLAR
jgi:hypothetical protein